ncbi:MAG: hypothetical protein OXH49_17130 [Gemmatimonadetes bacterium]|nr:hypothetical protein [Gemmatimonadota bacterium]
MKTSATTLVARTLLLAAVAGCGGGDTGPVTPPEPPRPATITIEPASATLTYITQSTPFSANVRDQFGSSMAVTVTWSGSDDNVFTVDANGTVTAVGNGTGTLTATTASISATAQVTVQQRASAVGIVSGNNQEALRNEPLPEPLVVQVEDRGGHGVAGLPVVFRPSSESGSASPDSVVTDDQGQASTVWTLGSKFGAQSLTIWAPGGVQNIAAARATSDNPLPDLSVERFLVSRLDPTSLETVDIDARIANNGDGESPDSFAVSLMLDGTTLETIHMAQLQPEDTANITFTAGPFEAGSRKLALQLDPDKEIDEWEKANNLLEASLNVARQEVIGLGQASMVSGTLDEVLHYRIDIETASSEALNVEVSGGEGDPDLFVTYGQRPDNYHKYRCFSGEQPGDAELCQLLPTRVGSYHVAIHAYSTFGPVELKVSVGGIPVDPFNIELVFVDPGTDAQNRVFRDAAERWESVIARDVFDVDFSFSPREAGTCGRGTPAINDVVDDIRMFVRIDSIDGPGTILGRAGPCIARRVPFEAAPDLPGPVVVGVMEFDEDDLPRLEAAGTLVSTITHEMGHVLGFGTMWEDYELIQNPSVGGNPSADTHFTGPLARAAFESAGGRNYRGGASVPLENGGNRGSADSHWRESVFERELMTPFLSAGIEPFSAITIESMADIGYEVDPTVADRYRITGGAPAADQGPVVYLGDDILRMPISVVDRQGRVVRVLRPR